MKYPFIECLGCTCEWALQGNFCKHQIVIIFKVTNVTQKDVIDYCGTWFGSNCKGLTTKFANPNYIMNYSNSKNDGEAYGEERVILFQHWFDWNHGGGCASYKRK